MGKWTLPIVSGLSYPTSLMPSTIQDILDSPQTRKPVVMGVLNLTPDSFSDGGVLDTPQTIIDTARRMLQDGADILDVGAESTRPGSARVSAPDQIQRLEATLPALCELAAESDAIVSVDTTLANVAEFALDCGVGILNDVSAGRDDWRLLQLAGQRGVPVVLMHMLGEPATMQSDPQYRDVVAEVREFLSQRIEAAVAAGVRREHCIVDPGIGFGKRLEHNLALLGGIDQLADLGGPILVGPSRKRFIGELTGRENPTDRLGGTLAACLDAYHRGATIFRIHDVRETRDALIVAEAIQKEKPPE